MLLFGMITIIKGNEFWQTWKDAWTLDAIQEGALIALGLFGVGAILQPVAAGAIVMVELFVGGLGFAAMGFIGGAIFSMALGLAEGRRRFDEMSLPGFIVLGALGGLFVSLIMGGGPYFIFTLLGAGSAGGSLALARWADDRELLEAGADIADVGLTEEETQQLLGGTG